MEALDVHVSDAESFPSVPSSQHTSSFAELLEQLGISIAVTTYQAGKLVLLRAIDGTINTAMEMSVTKALNGKIEGVQDAGVALATISACLVVPPTLFSVAAAIKAIGA